MKNFMALALAVLFMMFVTSCGDSKKTLENLPDSEVNDEDVDDEPTDEPTGEPTDEPTEPAAECGNKTVDEGEICDGGTIECSELSSDYSGGYAFCKADCSAWDESTCRTPVDPTDPADTGDTDEGDTDPADTGDTDEGDTDPADTGDTDEGDTDPADTGDTSDTGDTADTGDTGNTPVCVQIPNGDFSGTWEDGFPENWVKKGTSVTFSNVDGALKIESNYTNNQEVLNSAFFTTEADAEIPAGIKFKMATLKASPISINVSWGTGSNSVFYAYNWNPTSKVFEFAGAGNETVHNYSSAVDFGNTDLNETYIVFGSEINEHWRGSDKMHLRFRAGKSTTYGETEILIDDFELVYYGGECNNVAGGPYSVGSADLYSPASVEAAAGSSETFKGRVFIAGLTDATPNESEFLMGVKAQFGIKKKDVDLDYTWYEATATVATDESFGDKDEYQYTYTFVDAGEFIYAFRFSADNGITWTNTDSGTATITAVTNVQIPNSDFSSWTNDTTPEGWVVKSPTTLEKVDRGSGNYALKASRNSGSNGAAFSSPSFTIPSDSKIPQKIKFFIKSDNTVAISMQLNCGSVSQNYPWDTESHSFKYSGSHNYTNPIVFSNEGFNETAIEFGDEMTAAFWQGKTCTLDIRYGKKQNTLVSATFDDFEIVYPED